MTVMRITSFIDEDEVEFLKEYITHAIPNPSKQVALIRKKDGKLFSVDRDYYSVNSPLKIFDRVRKIAEKNYHVPITFRKDAYAQIMHYKTGSKGLDWHEDKNLCYVGASINLTPDYDHEGGNFEIWNSSITNPYRSMVMYDNKTRHRVTGVSGGEKLSLVMWLPKVGQSVSDGKEWRYE